MRGQERRGAYKNTTLLCVVGGVKRVRRKARPHGGLRSGRETLTGGRSAPGLCPHEGHDGLPDRLVEELPHAHHLGKLGIVAQAQRKRLDVGLGWIAGSDLLRRLWRLLFGGVAPVS